MEYLYSDAGQLALLHGYCHPVRYSELAAAGKIPADLAAQLPPAEAYKNVTFSTLDTERVIKAAITGGWDSTVGADVK
jgi:putative spermidine/putrescine transport system substrate-binding protein